MTEVAVKRLVAQPTAGSQFKSPPPADDSDLAEVRREHEAELADWDREFERQTGKFLWHRV